MQTTELAGILFARWCVARQNEKIIVNRMAITDFLGLSNNDSCHFLAKHRYEGGILFSEVE